MSRATEKIEQLGREADGRVLVHRDRREVRLSEIPAGVRDMGERLQRMMELVVDLREEVDRYRPPTLDFAEQAPMGAESNWGSRNGGTVPVREKLADGTYRHTTITAEQLKRSPAPGVKDGPIDADTNHRSMGDQGDGTVLIAKRRRDGSFLYKTVELLG